MSRIRSKDTKPELLVRRFLHRAGYRYRLHAKELPGCPDVVLPRYRTVIFIHGCFWHGHADCTTWRMPKTRTAWWRAKIEGNQRRDRRAVIALKDAGWQVLTLWECQLRPGERGATLQYVLTQLQEM